MSLVEVGYFIAIGGGVGDWMSVEEGVAICVLADCPLRRTISTG
jgi:hypothetical protein